jgi:hypothetical protein
LEGHGPKERRSPHPAALFLAALPSAGRICPIA